jgi:hypothetical protein
LTQLDSGKSMMRNLPPKGVAGLARLLGQVAEPLTASAGHDHRHRAARQRLTKRPDRRGLEGLAACGNVTDATPA